MAQKEFSGIWRSHYRYPSSSRHADFDAEHIVRFHQYDKQLIIESIPDKINKSYLMLHLTMSEGIATGTWQEETDPHGYYKGKVYYGAIQVVVGSDSAKIWKLKLGHGDLLTLERNCQRSRHSGTACVCTGN